MRLQPWKIWRRLTNLWDNLCVLSEQGLGWLLRGLSAPAPVAARRVRLGLEALETRLVPSGNPVANNDTYTDHQGQTLSVSATGVLANDTDPNGYTLHAIQVTGPSHGSLTLNGDGSLTYIPSSGFVGTDSFTYKDYDGVYYSLSAATVTINVTDTAPVAVADSYNVHQGQTLNVAATAGVVHNDSDADGDTLHPFLVTNTSHGSLSLDNSTGAFVYQPTAGFTGTDSFTYKDYDGALYGNTVTVTLNVTDTAPVARNDSYTVSGGSLSVSASGVLANDTDAEGDTLHASLVSGPAHASSFSLNSNGSFSYAPTTGFAGVDRFTYQDSDGALNSNTATVYLGVNDTAPTAINHSYVMHGGSLIVLASGVLAGSSDANGDSVFAVAGAGPSHGSLTLNANGSFSYTPNGTFAGSDSFTYWVSDGVLTSGVETVTINGPTLTGSGVTLNATAGIATVVLPVMSAAFWSETCEAIASSPTAGRPAQREERCPSNYPPQTPTTYRRSVAPIMKARFRAAPNRRLGRQTKPATPPTRRRTAA